MDFASNQEPFISPAVSRDLCLPSIKRRVADVKSRWPSVIKHACGNNWALRDFFVEAGYDAYQGIQISAGMDMADLKCRYGARTTLWGGVTVESLVGGTPHDVRRGAVEALRACAPGGGYILLAGIADEYVLKRPEDYRVWAYVTQATRDEPCYQAYAQYDREVGEDGLPLVGVGDVRSSTGCAYPGPTGMS